MKTSVYMKIPGVNGDVTEATHKKWIKVNHLNFTASRKISAEPGHMANRELTRPALSEFVINKPMDSASSLLFGEACTGKAKPKVIIELCKTGDQGLTTIAQYILENVIISSYRINTASASDHETHSIISPSETITLSYDKIEAKSIPHDEKGQAQTPVSYGYNLTQATALSA